MREQRIERGPQEPEVERRSAPIREAQQPKLPGMMTEEPKPYRDTLAATCALYYEYLKLAPRRGTGLSPDEVRRLNQLSQLFGYGRPPDCVNR